jgi:hypothetical protein
MKNKPSPLGTIYYIYAYLSKKGTPYYIGKGKNDRAYETHSRIKVPKDKNKIILLETNLTEIGALALERRMIRWWGRKDLGTGLLYNMTDGGDGISGMIMSKETREKQSKTKLGKIYTKEQRMNMSRGAIGKILSVETKAKMSVARKGIILSEEHKAKLRGKTRSMETRAKISVAFKGKPRSAETKAKIAATFLRKKNKQI